MKHFVLIVWEDAMPPSVKRAHRPYIQELGYRLALKRIKAPGFVLVANEDRYDELRDHLEDVAKVFEVQL